MHTGYEYHNLTEMYCVYLESNLASPLSGSATLEVRPDDTVRKIVNNFLLSLELKDALGLAAFDKSHNKLEWDGTVESQGIKEGSTLYLVYDGASFFQPFHVTVIRISAIVIAVILFITVSVLFGITGGDIPFDYGIVIDAGSTHTEVFLYEWSGSKFHGTGEVFQKDSCQIEDGIAKGDDPADIVSCVNNVTRTLPKDLTSPVTLYLGATGGMRILNISNPLDAHLILTAIKYALKTTIIKEGSIEIIQGEDEGIFSWITANFLSKTLNKHTVTTTYGALDLGGASTQLAFASDVVKNSSDVRYMKLYGYEYFVISKSFLCFGLSELSDRSKAVISIDEGLNETLNDPCLPDGYNVTLKVKEFFEKPCLKSDKIQSLIDHYKGKKIKFSGSSNYAQCRDVVKKLINPVSCKEMEFELCLSVMHIAEENRKFMAFSSFYYIVNYISPNGSLEEFVEATKQFCSLSYQQLRNKAHNQTELNHLLTYCFGAVSVSELLQSNYGFNDSTWKNIAFQQNINNADVGWSLGFMINATNAIPEEAPTPPIIGLNVFIPLISISVLMLLISAILLRKKFKHILKKEKEPLLDSIA